MIRRGLVLLAIVALLAGCVGAMQTTAHEPASAGDIAPTIEDKDAGLVGIAPSFDIKAYRVIAVDRLVVPEALVKDADGRKMAASLTVYFQNELVRRLREAGLFARVVHLGETLFTPGGQKTLRLQGNITAFDPGSRALRYFVGFAADRRVAAYGLFGGDSDDHLKESFDDMARDLAKFLGRLARGESPAR